MLAGNTIISQLKSKLGSIGLPKLFLGKVTTKHQIYGPLAVWCTKCWREIYFSSQEKQKTGAKMMTISLKCNNF